MPSEKVLHIKDVSISYDRKKPAITDVNLDVEQGEFLGLIGLNGAGKTTLMKAILGLRPVNAGVIELFGKPVGDVGTKKRLVFLPERFEPSWFLSGLEFLKFSASLYGQKLEDRECYSAAERIALDPPALKKRVQTYSKGMRQKLGVLASVLTRCDLLMLDEPMSGLDPMARALVKGLLMETKEQGRTIFLSSHILADMDDICDRVSVLYDKTIQFTGKPQDFKAFNEEQNLEKAFLHFIEKRTNV